MKSSLQAFVLIAFTAVTCLSACGSDDKTYRASEAAMATETSRSGLVADEGSDDHQETENGDKETYDPDQYDSETEAPELRDDLEISDKFDSGVHYNGVTYGSYGDESDETDPEENHDQRATFGN